MENKEKTQEQLDKEYQYDNGFQPKEVKLKDNYKFYPRGFIRFLLRYIIIFGTKLFLFIPKRLFWGYKVIGKKNKKYIKGSTVVCNHAFTFDAFSIVAVMWNKTLYTTMLQSNLGFGIASLYFRFGGGVPIPTNQNHMKKFLRETNEILEKKKNILVFPEAMLMPYADHIRAFSPGAFHFAINKSDNIIILLHTFHKPKGLYKLTRRKKPCIHLNILPPYIIKRDGNKKEIIERTQKEVFDIMNNYFKENSDYYF